MRIMVLQNPKQLTRSAFIQGFLRGLAAPVMMDSVHVLPEIPQFVPVCAPSAPIDQALAGDWQRVGADIHNVIEGYGKTERTIKFPADKKRGRKRR